MWKPNYSKVPKVQKVYNYPLKIYDNGGKSWDRYTVVYVHRDNRTPYTYSKTVFSGYDGVCMSENPTHPQGCGSYQEGIEPGLHLGKRILFKDLPKRCRDLVKSDIRDMKKSMKKRGIKL